MCPFSVRVLKFTARSFSWKLAHFSSVLVSLRSIRITSLLYLRLFSSNSSSAYSRFSICVSKLPSPSLPHSFKKYRNFYLLSIDYAFRPRLRSRLSQRGRAFLWRPWAIGAWDSHPRAATHAGILSSMRSTCPPGHASPLHAMLPYHIPVHSFGVMLSPGKLSAQSHSTSELLRTL